MTITTADITAFLTSDDKYKKIAALSSNHGNTLGELLVAVGAQGFSPDTIDVLAPFLNKGGTAKGRSGARANAAPAPVAADVLVGDDHYLRPNGEKYFTRKWGEHSDVLVLQKARESMHFPLLYGAPGCGKTALTEAAFGSVLYTLMGTGDTEVADLIGGYVPTDTAGQYRWEDGVLIKAMEAGAPLLVDEIGLIDPKVLSVLYGVMDGRDELVVSANPARGTIKAAPGFFVVAATNPNAPGVRLSEALLSRFTIHAELTTDWQLARKLGVPTAIVTAAQNLDKKAQEGLISWAPQFRELLAYRDLRALFGEKFAVANLIAAAPEQDRAQVVETLSKSVGETVLPAKI